MEVYAWRPRSLPGAALAKFSKSYRRLTPIFSRRKMNFGDELGPLIVERILQTNSEANETTKVDFFPDKVFFSVGSVTHVAKNGDAIWGSGALGGIKPALSKGVNYLEIYALRGPLTKHELEKVHQIEGIPEIFGDPGILFPMLFPEIVPSSKSKVLQISHIDDLDPQTPPGVTHISANNHPFKVARAIMGAELILTSSLHGKILSDAYGKHSVLYQGEKTRPFKFHDYSIAIQGKEAEIAPNVSLALKKTPAEPPNISTTSEQLLRAFPLHLFGITRK